MTEADRGRAEGIIGACERDLGHKLDRAQMRDLLGDNTDWSLAHIRRVVEQLFPERAAPDVRVVAADIIAMVAAVISMDLNGHFPNASVRKTATTSGCPIVEIKFASGDGINITITRARS